MNVTVCGRVQLSIEVSSELLGHHVNDLVVLNELDVFITSTFNIYTCSYAIASKM